MNRSAIAFVLVLLSNIAFPAMASAAPPELETRSFTIPSVDPGIELYVRNKHPAGMTTFSSDKTVFSFMEPPILLKRVSICRSRAFR
jgi:hypothetical protein